MLSRFDVLLRAVHRRHYQQNIRITRPSRTWRKCSSENARRFAPGRARHARRFATPSATENQRRPWRRWPLQSKQHRRSNDGNGKRKITSAN